MKPVRRPEFCEQCKGVFHTTSPYPERCSLCGSPSWDKAKKYPDRTLFDEWEVDA